LPIHPRAKALGFLGTHLYKELSGGYVSKCHLCLDIRRHIAEQTSEFEELRPIEFYRHL